MADEPKPGTVSFWERIGRLGLSGLATLGLLTASTVMIFKGVPVPQWYIALVVGVTGGTVYMKYQASK
jgi:hypothetical protein